MSQGESPARNGHGWWPYLLPYLSFGLAGELGNHLPDALQPLALFLQPGVPAALMLYFWRAGAYPELRSAASRPRPPGIAGLAMDVVLGVVLAVAWMAPFVLFAGLLPFDFMRPDTSVGFDPSVLGDSLVPLALGVRLLGYAVVTPFFEELFVRSFVMRYAEVWDSPRDFRDLPVGQFAWRGFVTTLVLFTITHQPWEWGVMFVWALVTNLWFYYRRHLMPVIIAHGLTNASILVFAVLGDGRFHDAQGNPMSLWFFL